MNKIVVNKIINGRNYRTTKNILDRLKSDKEMLPPPHLPSTFALLQIISSILFERGIELIFFCNKKYKKSEILF
jgi:hypothetical protein